MLRKWRGFALFASGYQSVWLGGKKERNLFEPRGVKVFVPVREKVSFDIHVVQWVINLSTVS